MRWVRRDCEDVSISMAAMGYPWIFMIHWYDATRTCLNRNYRSMRRDIPEYPFECWPLWPSGSSLDISLSSKE